MKYFLYSSLKIPVRLPDGLVDATAWPVFFALTKENFLSNLL